MAPVIVQFFFFTLFTSLFINSSAQGYNLSSSEEENEKNIDINDFIVTYLQNQIKDQNELVYDRDFMEKYKPRNKDSDATLTDEPFFTDESWSVIWYIASFSGLIAFFLVVSCSEWCCRKRVRIASIQNSSGQVQITPQSTITSGNQEALPPAYDLFAPPSYDSLNKPREKGEFDVYVVPVHAIDSMLRTSETQPDDDEPPSYSAVNLSFVRETEEENKGESSNDN